MTPRPDRPPRKFKPGPVMDKVTKLETFQKPDGSWAMRPTQYGRGTTDKALIPRIEVTPIQRRIQGITKRHNTPGEVQ